MTTAAEAKAKESTRWTIDPAHSSVEFAVKHMMFSTVRGRFTGVDGTIVLDPDAPERSSVEVEIDAASIDTGVEDRDGHLKSEDFLGVEEHPTITFRSGGVEGSFQEPGDTFRVTGDLTIRGETREVTLDATYQGEGTDPWGAQRIGFGAETEIDRRDFGLTWNQALEAGGVLVGHTVMISLEIQATTGGGESEEG